MVSKVAKFSRKNQNVTLHLGTEVSLKWILGGIDVDVILNRYWVFFSIYSVYTREIYSLFFSSDLEKVICLSLLASDER